MKSSRHQISRSLFGLFAIGLGLLFFFDNLGWLEARAVLRYWPVIFVIVGGLKLAQARAGSGMVLGGGLVVFGSLMLLERAGFITIGPRALWPLLLIIVGLAIVFKPSKTSNADTRQDHENSFLPTLPPTDLSGGDLRDSRTDATVVLGSFKRSNQSQNFQGGELTSLMGSCELDLRQASIQGEAVLEVFTMWGGIEVKVPPDWTVVMQGTPILGGFEEKTAIPPNRNKRLIVQGYAIMGGVEITN